mmetsp:Transcript_18275/g.57475  ORF Transcript_18275/g.57475 Transcript_18275/m.57475 type:complete len:433 (-) Transcript_18275:1326-2624(-)
MMRRGVWRLVASAGVVAALVSPVARSGVRGRAMWSWSRLEEDEGGQSLVGSGSVSSELRAKIEEYLSVRSSRLAKERTMREKRVAEREAATSNAVWRAGNALFSLESLLPEVPEDDGENEALAYTELERFGYSGLVEEIMDAGGHVAVSRALGIRVRGRAEPVVPEAPEPRLEPSRGLALGASSRETFDELPPEKLAPYRDLVAAVCGRVAATHPRLGYCQGIDYLVAYALRATRLEADAAVELVSALLDHLDLAGLFEPGLPTLKRRCLELGVLLHARCPALATHLADRSVHIELFAAAWLQTLFVYLDALPLAALDRAWTLLLLERSWKPLHRLALAIFLTLEDHLLAHCAQPHDLLLFLSRLANPDRRRAAPALLADPHLLTRAMNVKVTNSMLARIWANEALPKPLRARLHDAAARTYHPTLVTHATL